MIPIFLVILFIIQIIGFYFLVLLYTKLSKFDDLEKKQQNLMSEMDDSIAVYLSELKDENDRLIERLTKVELAKETSSDSVASAFEPVEKVSVSNQVTTPLRPINLAIKSYGQSSNYKSVPVLEEIELDDRTKIANLHDAGQTVEEIARALGKGKTEVELILKFR